MSVSQPRLSMRKIRDVLRLHAAGLTGRQIAHSVGTARAPMGVPGPSREINTHSK